MKARKIVLKKGYDINQEYFKNTKKISLAIYTEKELLANGIQEENILEGFIATNKYDSKKKKKVFIKTKSKKNDNKVEIPFNIIKEVPKFYKNIGFVKVDSVNYIRICVPSKSIIVWIMLILAGIALILLGGWFTFGTRQSGHIFPSLPWLDKEQHEPQAPEKSEKPNTEYTTIPGYTKITATDKKRIVQLKNPKVNTVYFVYTITEDIASSVVKSFNTITEAQDYATKNSPVYTNKKQNGQYGVVDKAGNFTKRMISYTVSENKNTKKYDVVKTTSTVIYFTGSIKPGYEVDWDVKSTMSKGNHKVKFRISTFDTETAEPCYGGVVEVEVQVN